VIYSKKERGRSDGHDCPTRRSLFTREYMAHTSFVQSCLENLKIRQDDDRVCMKSIHYPPGFVDRSLSIHRARWCYIHFLVIFCFRSKLTNLEHMSIMLQFIPTLLFFFLLLLAHSIECH